MITLKQKALLNKLAVEKGQTLGNIDTLSKQQASNKISELFKLKTVTNSYTPSAPSAPVQEETTIQGFEPLKEKPTTEKKVAMVTEGQLKKLQELGKDLNLKPDMLTLSRFTSEKASQTISQMIELKKRQVGTGPSDEQIEMLKDMASCPEIIKEDFISLFPINSKLVEYKKQLLNRHRFLLKDSSAKQTELATIREQLVKANTQIDGFITDYDWKELDRQQVRDFIGTNSKAFYNWKTTLVTDAQVSLIKRLLNDINRVNGWIAQTDSIPTDINGERIVGGVQDGYIKDETYDIFAPLSDDDFKYMTKDVASEFISKLKMEQLRVTTPASTLETPVEYDAKRSILSSQASSEAHAKRIINMLYSLEAMLGTEPEIDSIEGSNVNKYIGELVELAVLLEGESAVRDVFEYSDVNFDEVMQQISENVAVC